MISAVDGANSSIRCMSYYLISCLLHSYISLYNLLSPIDHRPSTIEPFNQYLQLDPSVTLQRGRSCRYRLLARPTFLHGQFDSLDLESSKREFDLGFDLVSRVAATRDVVDFEIFLVVFENVRQFRFDDFQSRTKTSALNQGWTIRRTFSKPVWHVHRVAQTS